MAFEPERKYLIDTDKFLEYLASNPEENEIEKLIGTKDIMQSYLNNSGDWTSVITSDGQLILSSESARMGVTYNLDNDDTQQLINYPTTKKLTANKYLIDPESWVARIRIYDDLEAEICLKERVAGDNRGECEDSSSVGVAKKIFISVDERIAKIRHYIMLDGYKWEVDLFRDRNKGLCIGELETEDKNYPLLSFIIKEVTDDIRYYNDNLSSTPYTEWN